MDADVVLAVILVERVVKGEDGAVMQVGMEEILASENVIIDRKTEIRK